MNVTCIPYHDWRKIEMEGTRTRDSHIIHHLSINKNIDKILIINRPISYPELVIKKRFKKISGKIVFKHKSCTLYKITDKLFVLDYISMEVVKQLYKKKMWFFESFGSEELLVGYKECLKFLSIEIDLIFTQNIFSAHFFRDNSIPIVFDAWDNFVMFPSNKKYKESFIKAYQTLASVSNNWITNSVKNINYYNESYAPKKCYLLKNGVDVELFTQRFEIPKDLARISSPILGFGGKITHLFDYDLFNQIVQDHPDKSFVIVGQILDKNIFKKIIKAKNVYYLGDKHYSKYTAYVTNFDIGIVPYVNNLLDHGGDSIKVYEYLASGLNVVGTASGGMSDLKDYIYVAESKKEFSKMIDIALNEKRKNKLPEIYSWKSKVSFIVDLFRKTIDSEQVKKKTINLY